MSSSRGLTAKGVPPQPMWMTIIKGVIMFLSVVILALAAYAISLVGTYYGGYYYYGSGAPGFMIFIVVKTLLIFGGLMAVEKFAPHVYYRLIAVIAYALSIVFWLSGWAWCASWAAAYLSIADYTILDTTYTNDWAKKEGGALAAAAGLGAITWVLCIVHLVFFIQCCMRNPDGDAAPAVAANGMHNAELGNMQKQETAFPAQPYPAATQPYPVAAQQPQYAPQPYAQAPYPQQQQQQQQVYSQ